MPLYINKSTLTDGKQAQQNYRFILAISGINAALIKNVNSPKYTIETESYDILEYKVNYPTKAVWQPVSFEIVQIIDKDVLTSTIGYFMGQFYNSDYYASPLGIGSGKRDILIPDVFYNAKEKIESFANYGTNTGYVRSAGEGTVLDFSKQKLTGKLGIVEIKSLDEDGKEYDSWKLAGAMITEFAPSDFSYDDEKVSTIKVRLTYDWAEYGFRGVYAEQDVLSRIVGI